MMNRYVFRHPLWIALLLLLSVVSCIFDDMSHCAQYTIAAKIVDTQGNQIPPSSVNCLKAYLFINDKFSRVVYSDADGRFNVAFGDTPSASLVVLGATDAECVVLYSPTVGEDISNISLELAEGADAEAQVYYGRYDYKSDGQPSTQTITLVVQNQQAHLRVIVKNPQQSYGNGDDFHIRLSGFRKSLSFQGETKGDIIEYTPKVWFNSNNHLESETVSTLPTQANDRIEVAMYKDAELILQSDKDENGNAISLAAGDDKVLILDCSQPDMFIRVTTWEEYVQEVIMP